jgi:hypothetical protein
MFGIVVERNGRCIEPKTIPRQSRRSRIMIIFLVFIFPLLTMGANWYDFESFLGIKVPLKKLKALYKRFADEPKSVFGVYIYEKQIHSRTECEDHSDTLERCTGFLGIVEKQFSADELVALRHEFAEFLRGNRKILKEIGVEITDPVVRGGIKHNVKWYLEDLESDMESGDDDSDGSDN